MKFKAAVVKSRNVINATVQPNCHIYSSFALSVLDHHIKSLICLHVYADIYNTYDMYIASIF